MFLIDSTATTNTTTTTTTTRATRTAVASTRTRNSFAKQDHSQHQEEEEEEEKEKQIIASVNILKSLITKVDKTKPAENRSLDSMRELLDYARNAVNVTFNDYLSLRPKSSSSSWLLWSTGAFNADNEINSSNPNNHNTNTDRVTKWMQAEYANGSSSLSNGAIFAAVMNFLYANDSSDHPIIMTATPSMPSGARVQWQQQQQQQQLSSFRDTTRAPIDRLVSLFEQSSESLLAYDAFPATANSYASANVAAAATAATTFDVSDGSRSTVLVAIAFFYSLLVLISLTSNPLLIYVLLWRRKAQIKLIDIFVANLSLSDLFLTIFNIPLCLIIYFSEQWPFGSLVCQLGTYSTSCSIYVNIFTMAYISIDRYFAVTRISNPNCAALRTNKSHLDGTTKRKIYSVLTFIWIVALILSLPQFLFSKVSSQRSNQSMTAITSQQHTPQQQQQQQYAASDEDDDEMNDLLWSPPSSDALLLGGGGGGSGGDDASPLLLDDDIMSFERVDFGEDPFKRCILEYPLKNMKNYMILINFSLQYLIPSVVILYFYGRIIYHLYLNLNVEDFMDDKADVKAANLRRRDANGHNSIPRRSNIRMDFIIRKRNLKKSMKLMIIIILLFLLSWLPIHLYRLVTTFYPLVAGFLADVFLFGRASGAAMSLRNSTHLLNATNIELCKHNISSKECLVFALRELKDINDDTNNLSFKLNTLHNRYVFFVAYFMAMSSVCYNPIVYFWMHKKFRAEVRQILSRLCRCSSTNSGRSQQQQQQQAPGRSYMNTTRALNSAAAQYNKQQQVTTTATSKRELCLLNNSDAHTFGHNSKFGMIVRQAQLNTSGSGKARNGDLTGKHCALHKAKKKHAAYIDSFRAKNKRFSSLSSESTTSSSKKSETNL